MGNTSALKLENKPVFSPDDEQTHPRYELSDIFRNYFPSYDQRHPVLPSHVKVIQDIINCRTDVLGGHLNECNECGEIDISYNSCRNRHCPKCQGSQRYQWVASRELELLPVQYFHMVFTLPGSLLPLSRGNQELCYDLLFKTAAETLQQFAQERWGGQLGIIMVLHTWGQVMNEHPHVHCIVTGGVLKNDGSDFVISPKNYLFPVKALSPVFRQKYIEGLLKLKGSNHLSIYSKSDLNTDDGWERFIKSLYRHNWVVYSKKPFSEPSNLLRYIGRYINRVAISNHRILSIKEGRVSFSYHDNRDDKNKVMTLTSDEFIRRFMTHILPKGFRRIRYFGFMVNSLKKNKLALCRELLKVPNPEQAYIPDLNDFLARQDQKEKGCPYCGAGKMQPLKYQTVLLIYWLLKSHAPPEE